MCLLLSWICSWLIPFCLLVVWVFLDLLVLHWFGTYVVVVLCVADCGCGFVICGYFQLLICLDALFFGMFARSKGLGRMSRYLLLYL